MRRRSALPLSSLIRIAVLVAVCVPPALDGAAWAQAAGQSGRSPAPEVLYPLQFTVSPPVRTMPPQAYSAGPPEEIPQHRPHTGRASGSVVDPVLQTSTATASAAQTVGQWEGLGAGFPGYSVTAVPPDPNIAVGPHHIVQWVNNAFVVFDKQGGQIQGPIADSTFWGSSTCNQLGGYSDPIIQYDRIADRWLVGEVAIPLLPGYLGQFAQCVAVSTTSDPTGSYYMWAYGFGTSLNDYPKIGMWPDAYYITWNIFQNGSAFVGPEACAFDRKGMLNGNQAPALVCFKPGSAYASLLPSDLDGATLPPAGSPNYVMSIDPASSAMYLWKFHVDFANPANSTFAGPTSVGGVAPFTSPCLDTQDCIPQPGTTEKLDALGDRLMYRLAYRNFGGHASIVANHTVLAPDGNTAVRWYEVRSPDSTPTIFQQGTFAPDTENRWMGSLAMDRIGNIAVGYSVASALTSPSIRFTGWEVGGTPGQLESEMSAVVGSGAQTGYNRWGDYSAMRIDPSDDCTFWYTQEYQATTASANWNTRIVSFKFPSCGSLTATTTTLGASPNPSTVGQGVVFTATVSPSAATGNVQFFDGSTLLATVALGGGQATLTTSTLAAGSHSITAVYGGDSAYSGGTSNVVTQTVNNTVAASYSLSASPSSKTVSRGKSASFTISVTPTGGFTGNVQLSVSGVPSQSTSGFSVNPVAAGSTSTLTISTSRKTPKGRYTLTITGTSGSLTASTTVTLTVQ